MKTTRRMRPGSIQVYGINYTWQWDISECPYGDWDREPMHTGYKRVEMDLEWGWEEDNEDHLFEILSEDQYSYGRILHSIEAILKIDMVSRSDQSGDIRLK